MHFEIIHARWYTRQPRYYHMHEQYTYAQRKKIDQYEPIEITNQFFFIHILRIWNFVLLLCQRSGWVLCREQKRWEVSVVKEMQFIVISCFSTTTCERKKWNEKFSDFSRRKKKEINKYIGTTQYPLTAPTSTCIFEILIFLHEK